MNVASAIFHVSKRNFVKKKLVGYNKLHLASGNNVLDGWANIDIKGNNKVIGWDLTYGIPVKPDSIDLIFCEHFIEHISLNQAGKFLSQLLVCLRPGGILRISTPKLEKLLNEYLSGRIIEWYDVRWQPASPCQMVNEGLRSWGHKFVYDENELYSLLIKTGFREIRSVKWHDSSVPDLRNLECRPYHDEIIFEAIK